MTNKQTTQRIRTTVLVAVVLAVALTAGVAGAQISQRFNDVPDDHYAADAVDWAVAAGITGGCGDGTNFCPDTNLNRAHMVTFLYRYHGWLTGNRPASAQPPEYADYAAALAEANQWYTKMAAIIGNGNRIQDWKEVLAQAVTKLQWTSPEPATNRAVFEIQQKVRHGDVSIDSNARTVFGRHSEIAAQRFYAGAVGYVIARSAADAAGASDATVRQAAAAAAWADAGAKLAALAEGRYFRCEGCRVGEWTRVGGFSSGDFDFKEGATSYANLAADSYFSLAS